MCRAELCIGLISDQQIETHYKNVLSEIQDRLFTIGAALASDPEKSNMVLPDLTEADIELLEKEMDTMEEKLSPLKNFILPGGHTTVSFCHLARVVCRRAERIVSHLGEVDSVPPLVIKYLNRLSDFLFVLSRKLSRDLEVEEIPWRPRSA